ncbi:polyprenyl synthetase family protein [Prolixibacteraceae bacterium JC049]|nr:polyprenyl synthetase family protein [Prolixibacteraceae bacterium JC049]
MLTFKSAIERINQKIEEELKEVQTKEPAGLYSPIIYTLQRGGKRIRPVLALLTYNMYREDLEKVYPAALAIEIFHNFTLLHDDIMDDADIRRGEPTVHKRFNENAAILSGDAMSILAYQYLGNTPTNNLQGLLQLFNQTAMEICEGQQYDMEFEDRSDVTVEEYLTMIKLKTAVLLACSMKAGAMVAEAPAEDAQHLYDFGINLGLAFQLQDDLLDVYGDASVFGKKIGGDIIANKKTFLLLNALCLANSTQKEELERWINQPAPNREEKVTAVTQLYNELGVKELSQEKMEDYYEKAINHLNQVKLNDQLKSNLLLIAQKMMNRDS